MEVDALKGKGKGKGGQPTQRACLKCGQLGHMKRGCRNPPARGGGKGGKSSGKGGKGGEKGEAAYPVLEVRQGWASSSGVSRRSW